MPTPSKLAGALLGLAVTTAVGLSALPSHAQDDGEETARDEDKAAAQILFDEGRALLGEEKYEQACEKFAESMRLDKAIGTQLNLADCYEKTGKLASSWINFVEAATRARKEGQETRVQIAEERAEALQGRLSQLTLIVSDADVDGLVVERNGEEVRRPQWGVAVPIDGGRYSIRASAPGKESWETSVVIEGEGDRVTVDIPFLDDAPEEPDPKPVPKPVETGLSGQAAAGWVFFATAGVSGVLAGVFGGLAASKNGDSEEFCPFGDNRCTSEGVALRDEALTFAHVSTATLAVCGATLLTSIILLATDGGEDEPESDPEAAQLLLDGGIGVRF